MMKRIEKCGFLVSQNIGKSTVVSSVCTEMVISQEHLRSQNPIEGLIHFCKFCDELCQGNIELDSHLWLFLYWLEFYTTISLMSITVLLSKPKEKLREVCIPKSFEQNAETLYLAFSEEDDLIPKLCNKQILKRYEKDLLKSPACLSKLLCGIESKSSLLDIIFLEKNNLRERQIPLDDLDVLSQRILLISLVIFCNLGRGFHGSKKIEEEMALKLCSGRWQKHTSEQVKETFKTLRDKKQTCPGNFQDALLSLVFERENDSLRCFGYTQDKNSFFETLFDESKYRQNFLSKETIKIVKNPTAYLGSKENEQFQVHEVKKGNLLDIPNMRDVVSEKEHGIPSNKDMKSDNVTNPGEKAEEDTNVREQKIVEKKIDSDNKSIDETKSNNTGSRNDNAANVIIRFWRSFIFNRKVVDLCKHLRKQITREKNAEIEERFTCLEMDATICNVCGIPFKSNVNITTSKNEVMLYERVNGGDYEKPDVLSEEFNITCPEENKHFVDNEIQDNPFQLLLKNDSKRNNLNLENKGEHEASESHQKKLQEFEIFKEKFYSEVYDTIRDIERFIEIYNLRDEETLKRYSDMSDYIGSLCDENMYLDELVNKIIRDRDWCNRDIEEKVKNVCFILSSIKDGVKRTALENKKKMQTSGSIDTEEMGLNNKKTKKGKKKFIPTGKFTFSSM
ncbi:uncharacterized protein LOC134267506 [Saccostrea cucullata]|uniref:uncharacterized protein LOC134267506 n=1 Tax=Saccostrea cuccullata TaxID=36930 RepID=UPI002ED0848E